MNIPTSVTRTVGRQLLLAQKNSPKLLFLAGIAGFGATVVLSSRATLKLSDVLEASKKSLDLAKELHDEDSFEEYDDTSYQADVAKIYLGAAFETAKLYAPAIVIGGLSIACLTKSHNLLAQRNAAITAAYVGLQRAYDSYRDRVCAEYGREKEFEIYHGVEVCEIDGVDKHGKEVVKKEKLSMGSHSPYARFFDRTNKHWNHEHDHNVIYITMQQNYLNDRLKSRGHVFLNEAYDMLGIAHSTEGAVTGWVMGNGDDYIDFGQFHSRDASNYRGRDGAILLDFNVDGLIYEII